MELQFSGSPVGSGSAGKMSLGPQILHAATAVTMAAKAKKGPRDWVARSRGVGMLDCLFRILSEGGGKTKMSDRR